VSTGNNALARRLFHAITVKNARPPTYSDEESAAANEYATKSAKLFFARLGGALDVRGRSVLDIGCGDGSVCIEAIGRGATRAVGVDMQPLAWPRRNLQARFPELHDRIELIETDGSLRELGEQQCDVMISKDSFEHYDDPESFVSVLTRFLAPGGSFAVGFGPLWKGPTGGHIDFMTSVPWAHLMFDEATIMAERRRFRPAENARSFSEVRGGLNKMTLARFESIMSASGLRPAYFATNVSSNPVVRVMDVASRVPPLREYFTANVYSVWQKPAAS